MRHARIHITGIVQGVGMRPFVYREAASHGVSGWVLNAEDGVHIEAHADGDALDAFVAGLRGHAPAAARIEDVEVTPIEGGGETRGEGFRIIASEGGGARTTLVSPDIATCPDCLRELFDPADRRFHYPFINCTNCGPRFTIIRDLPYDRPLTSMGAFPMCATCAAEYGDPLDRRFHAQPDACFECGPHISWRERGGAPTRVGTSREASDEIIERCAALIAEGSIVAIKGLGGFHLACDAGNEEAVAELRRRKRRGAKPLAIMVAGIDAVKARCLIDPVEREVLEGSAHPIVLLRRRRDDRETADSVAGDLPELGVMLPYTPLQHLLLAACARCGVTALVMTSGNASGNPIETDDAEAWRALVDNGIADALLGNDRAILARYDDSVVRVSHGSPMPIRRARGYAPRPISLPSLSHRAGESGPCLLACGAEQKATLALVRGRRDGSAECFLSQHIGDVENAAVLDAWHEARARMQGLFGIEPAAIACDLHPGYLASQWARERARGTGTPLVEVQHHHAHIAAVVAEAACRGEIPADDRVVGIALDGTGAGPDGTIWGGEILIADLMGFERAAHLAPWPLPGGAASVRDPRRSALSLLASHGLLEHPGARRVLESIGPENRAIIETMASRGINSPMTSSMGRLFDAVSALLGICEEASYEGEPAILLEAAASRSLGSRGAIRHPPAMRTAREGVLDPAPMLEYLLDGIRRGVHPDDAALDFHLSMACAVSDTAIGIARREGIGRVALSGGVFMNRLFSRLVIERVEGAGLAVLTAHDVPCNDGGIAYGQAAVAWARLSASL